MSKGFLIGETLLGQIKDTVKRVDGMPEGGNITRIPTRFESMPVAASGKVFRICTFTGGWSVGSEKTVTFSGVTATPNTVSATNLFFPITNTATGDRTCAIAKDGTAWSLVGVKVSSVTRTVVTDVQVSGSINTANCSISIARTLTTTHATFVEYGV